MSTAIIGVGKIGGALATSFAKAAAGDMQSSHAALVAYGEAKYLYAREVDVHSHWSGLAILLVLFGALFNRTGFTHRTRMWLASLLSFCSFAFPMSVVLQNFDHGQLPRVLAIMTSGILILSMLAVAVGFMRSSES